MSEDSAGPHQGKGWDLSGPAEGLRITGKEVKTDEATPQKGAAHAHDALFSRILSLLAP